MDFRVLGPVEMWQDGRPLDIGSRRVRFVLAQLLLTTGRLTSAETLIDGLWPDDPPPTARAQLHNVIGHLRRTLGDDSLATRPGGYELRLDEHTLDLHEFRLRARQAAAATDHESAVATATQALALWRGPALDNLDGKVIADQRAALHEERMAATETQLSAYLALGRADAVLRRLPDLLTAEPYRERLHEFHLRALQATGGDTHTAYENLHTRFVEDLGIEPGATLRALGTRAETPKRQVPQQLPPAAALLTGRANVLAEITSALRDGGTAVLVGAAGAGKTTLAVAAAHELRASYPDGQLYAELRGSRPNPVDPQSVLSRFIRSLTPDTVTVPADPAQRITAYRERLENRRVLIVLDDAGSAEQIRPLLAPGCGVVVTSRQRLTELPDVTRWSVPMLTPADSLTLLTRMVGEQRVTDDPTAAADIAALCGHSPLGVCIAGARLGMHRDLPLTDFRDRLAERTQRLDELAVGDLDVRTTIALSYEALTDNEQRLFRRLGLASAPNWPEWVAGESIDALVNEHLIEPVGVDAWGQRRYRLHDLVADFARERLAEEETQATADAMLREMLTNWYALTAAADEAIGHGSNYTSGLPSPPPPPFPVEDPQGWLEAERASLVAAVEDACRLNDAELAAGLALRAAGYFGVRAYDEERAYMLTAAAEQARPKSDALLVRVLNALFATYQQQSRYLELTAITTELLAAARRLHDPEWELRALHTSGYTARSAGRLNEAAQRHEEAVALARKTSAVRTLTDTLVGLADVYAEAGIPKRGLPLYEEVLELEKDDTRSRKRAMLLHSYGMTLVDAGDLPKAREVLTTGIAVAQALGDEFGVATISQKLADAEIRSGETETAATRLKYCLLTHERLDNHEGVAWTLRSSSDLAAVEGRWADAAIALERALEILLQVGEPLEIARTLDRLARALTEQGREREAAPHRAECAAILTHRGLGEECLDHPPRIGTGTR